MKLQSDIQGYTRDYNEVNKRIQSDIQGHTRHYSVISKDTPIYTRDYNLMSEGRLWGGGLSSSTNSQRYGIVCHCDRVAGKCEYVQWKYILYMYLVVEPLGPRIYLEVK